MTGDKGTQQGVGGTVREGRQHGLAWAARGEGFDGGWSWVVVSWWGLLVGGRGVPIGHEGVVEEGGRW